MNDPVSPAPPLRVAPGPAGSVDDDASLTVDQVSEEPPEVSPILAVACRDALLQSAPCPLFAQEKAGARPVVRLPRPRSASAPKPSLALPASKVVRPAVTASRGVGLAKGEMVSLEGGGDLLSEMLAASCREQGPRLALTGRQPEVIEEEPEELLDIEADPEPLPPPPPPPVPSRRNLTPSPVGPVVVTEVAPKDAPVAVSERSASLRVKPSALTRITTSPAPPVVEAPRSAPEPGGPKPIAVISDFDDPPSLDPRQAYGIPIRPPAARPRKRLHPKAVALFGGLFGLAAIGTLITFAIRFGPAPSKPTPPAKSAAATATTASEAPRASASAAEPAPPPDPGPWRVSALSSEEGVKMISGKLGTKSLMAALEEEHVPKAQIFRILKAFDDPKLFDKPRKSHQYTVALDRASKRVRGFEYAASTTEVWQAREVDEKLTGTKLDLKIEQRKIAKGVVVDGSLKGSLVEAGFDDDMVGMLDDLLSDRLSIDRLGKGASLRIAAQEQLVASRFSKYLAVDALEYRLPRSDKRARLYHFRNGKISGVFDGSGKAPFRASWGPPLKVVRVTSKFNPKRLHPVLHTVMPHNGTDFGAPMGTPVYAVASGTVSHIGPQGPSGNLVLVVHPNGLESGYAHLSKFAQGLKKGDKVEAQQLVGYVGSTGRSTGPHLHFSIKKNGVFIDALTILKLNQERVVPKSDREAFDAFRAEMDKILDAIPLADAPAGDATPDPDDNDHGDENNHGDENEAPAASGAPPASAPPAGSAPEPPPAPPVTDDTSPESAIWRPD